ncbi:MAG: CehA/McbA family metallohydrolase [Methanomassiliicoccaceae archaeon]|jgi:predicted metal-dependent phosphoesterase TrpH|nr:CehA/McbA family metallohydrolase [Methanomassiliicoccaceae archaeon]
MMADLHIHSTFSNDGRSTVDEIIKAAKAKGLGCIAITDHNSFASFEEASKYDGIIVIPGEEVSSAEGHILAYGINCEIPRGKTVSETIDMIHDAGGIAVAAHPYRWWSGLGENNVIPEFDAVEAFNARSTKGSNNKAYKLASKMKKPITAGSDAHHIDSIASAYAEFSNDITDHEGIIKAILGNEVKLNGRHRTRTDTIRYGHKSITEWIGRGFKKM